MRRFISLTAATRGGTPRTQKLSPPPPPGRFPKPSFAASWRTGYAVVGRKSVLDAQRQRLDVPARARIADKGRLQKRLEETLG